MSGVHIYRIFLVVTGLASAIFVALYGGVVTSVIAVVAAFMAGMVACTLMVDHMEDGHL